MPVTTRKEKGDGYTNYTPGGVKGRHMTKANAKAQANILRAVEHNPKWRPTHKKSARARMKKAVTG